MRSVSCALIAIALEGCSFSVGASSSGDAAAGHDGPGNGDGPTDGVAIDAALIDAPPVDAAFDPATCPAGYTMTIAASPQSRYRWITVDRAWLAQHQDCADDLPGATHLAVLDTVAEAQQIAAAAAGATSYQVGAAQAPAQATVLAGWYELTGEVVPAATWQSGHFSFEPRDIAERQRRHGERRAEPRLRQRVRGSTPPGHRPGVRHARRVRVRRQADRPGGRRLPVAITSRAEAWPQPRCC